ncbi:MAG: porin family protein [Bacteroidales bacterium]|jgi:hypothetical protein
MKIKCIAIFIMALLVWAPGQAQLKFGIRGGINASRVKLKEFDNPDYRLDYESGQVGFHFGGIAQLKMGMVFIQPELLFTNVKTDVSVQRTSGGETWIGKQSFNKLDLPVIAGVKIGPLKLQAGPVASVVLNSKSNVLDDRGIDQSTKGATIGYQAGVGLQLGSLLVDVKYEGNLSKLGDGVTIGGQDFNFDQRLNQIIFSIGFLF